MEQAQRKSGLLERLTPSTPVPRPEAVVWAAWLLMAELACILIIFCDALAADLRVRPDQAPPIALAMRWILIVLALVIFAGVVSFRHLMMLTAEGRRRFTERGGRSFGLLPLLLFGYWRWQTAAVIFRESGWSFASAPAVSEAMSLGLWVLLIGVLALLGTLRKQMLTRDEVVAAFAAAAEARE
jgi:hypothetical protein